METKMLTLVTDINIDGTLSVLMQTEAGNHREALVPGQFDRAKEILPDDLYQQVEALWTEEIVTAYQAKLMQLGGE